MEFDLTKIAMNVRIARAKKNISLRQLSKDINCSITTLSFVENARKKVRISTLARIATALDTTLEEIIN